LHNLSHFSICRDNIWKNVLYINNFSSEWGVDWCLPHTWYLDVMMQLFLVSPLVILPMWWIAKKKEDTGKGSIMAAAFAGAIVVVFTAVMVGMDAASKDWNNMMAR
jgi:peptidoglycan/LPS O-acetylase OafA/YrhL